MGRWLVKMTRKGFDTIKITRQVKATKVRGGYKLTAVSGKHKGKYRTHKGYQLVSAKTEKNLNSRLEKKWLAKRGD